MAPERVGPMAARCHAAAQRVPLRLGLASDVLALRPEDASVLRAVGLRELPLLAFYRRTVPRLTVGWAVEFAEQQGLLPLLRGRTDLRLDALLPEASAALGWSEDVPGLRAILQGFLGTLAEVQLLAEHGGRYAWRGEGVAHDLALPADEALLARELFAGTLAWYRACLDALPAVLHGAPPPLGFDPRHLPLWEGFLGSPEQVLIRRVALAAAGPPPAHVLDLGCGPGTSTACIVEAWPGAAVTALDLGAHAYPSVEEHARHSAQALAAPLDLTLAKPWAGWGTPLPFPDGTFDLVFVPLLDGYVPHHRRTEAYREVRRVLRPRGAFLLVTAPLPSAQLRVGPWEQRAKTWLHHAVGHSVVGFHGLATAEEHQAAAREAGFAAASRPWRFAALAARWERGP